MKTDHFLINAGLEEKLYNLVKKEEEPEKNPEIVYPLPIMGYEKNSEGNLPTLDALLRDKLSKEVIYNNNQDNQEQEEKSLNNTIEENKNIDSNNIDNNIDSNLDTLEKKQDNNLIKNSNLSMTLEKSTLNKRTLPFLKKIANQEPNL